MSIPKDEDELGRLVLPKKLFDKYNETAKINIKSESYVQQHLLKSHYNPVPTTSIIIERENVQSDEIIDAYTIKKDKQVYIMGRTKNRVDANNHIWLHRKNSGYTEIGDCYYRKHWNLIILVINGEKYTEEYYKQEDNEIDLEPMKDLPPDTFDILIDDNMYYIKTTFEIVQWFNDVVQYCRNLIENGLRSNEQTQPKIEERKDDKEDNDDGATKNEVLVLKALTEKKYIDADSRKFAEKITASKQQNTKVTMIVHTQKCKNRQKLEIKMSYEQTETLNGIIEPENWGEEPRKALRDHVQDKMQQQASDGNIITVTIDMDAENRDHYIRLTKQIVDLGLKFRDNNDNVYMLGNSNNRVFRCGGFASSEDLMIFMSGINNISEYIKPPKNVEADYRKHEDDMKIKVRSGKATICYLENEIPLCNRQECSDVILEINNNGNLIMTQKQINSILVEMFFEIDRNSNECNGYSHEFIIGFNDNYGLVLKLLKVVAGIEIYVIIHVHNRYRCLRNHRSWTKNHQNNPFLSNPNHLNEWLNSSPATVLYDYDDPQNLINLRKGDKVIILDASPQTREKGMVYVRKGNNHGYIPLDCVFSPNDL